MPMPVSLHRDDDVVGVAARAHVDAAAVGRELDRVGQQVEQDLLELALVGDDLAELRVARRAERDAVPLRALAHQRHRVGERGRQVERRKLELHAPGLDLRQVEDVVDQR